VATVERALARLQALVRQRSSGNASDIAMTRRLPPDLTGGRASYMVLQADQVDAANAIIGQLQADPRFEHLRDAASQVWYFAAQCWLDRQTNHVPVFLTPTRKAADEPNLLSPYRLSQGHDQGRNL
jgi:hypothetical protein